MVTPIVVSPKHLAILAINSKSHGYSRENHTMTIAAPAHAGVNVLLGGAMMSCMLVMILCICYMCHWRFQKTETRYDRRNACMQVTDSESPIHIFTLGQQCYDESGLFHEREAFEQPPPAYEAVISRDKAIREGNDPDLPSYEMAVKLSSRGYV